MPAVVPSRPVVPRPLVALVVPLVAIVSIGAALGWGAFGACLRLHRSQQCGLRGARRENKGQMALTGRPEHRLPMCAAGTWVKSFAALQCNGVSQMVIQM